MAVILDKKNGGPYTIKDKEERKFTNFILRRDFLQ